MSNYGQYGRPSLNAAMQRSASVGGGCNPQPEWVQPNYGCYPGGQQICPIDPVAAAAMQCIPGQALPQYGIGGGGQFPFNMGNNPALGNNPFPPGFIPPWFCNTPPRGPQCIVMGIPATVIPALGSMDIIIHVVNPSQLCGIDVPSDIVASLNLDALTLAGEPLQRGSIPLRLYSEVAEGCAKCCFPKNVIMPWMDLVMTVSNTLNANVTMRGALALTENRC